MIAKTKYKEYEGAYSFLNKCSLEEIKEVFKEHLSELDIKLNKNKLSEIISTGLNSFGWSDEEIILEVLKHRDKKYILNFVFDGNNGYFEVFELK